MAPTLLLITKDAPTSDRRKAGLFPVAIRHHLALGAKVLLYAIEDGHGMQAATLTGFSGLIYLNAEMRPPGRLMAKWHAASTAHRNRELTRAARQHDVAAVCGLQSAPQSGLLARRIAMAIGCPFASWEHLTSYGRPEARLNDVALKRFFQRAGAVAAVSTQTLKAIERRYNLSLANGMTIPNPVPEDFETGKRPNPNRYEALTEGGFTFGAWTNWRDLKRLDVLLDAFGQVAQLRPEARLIVAGPMSSQMQQAMDGHWPKTAFSGSEISLARKFATLLMRWIAAAFRAITRPLACRSSRRSPPVALLSALILTALARFWATSPCWGSLCQKVTSLPLSKPWWQSWITPRPITQNDCALTRSRPMDPMRRLRAGGRSILVSGSTSKPLGI